MVIQVENKQELNKVREFEKEYFPCGKEWWCIIGFFTTVEDNKKWCFKVDLSQSMGRDKTIWSFNTITFYNLENKRSYNYIIGTDTSKLESKKEKFHIGYDKTYVEGTYPDYKMKFVDPRNEIDLDITYHAESIPYWVAEQITDGWLPWGLGYLRYGYIPKNKIKGKFNIKGKKFTIKGEGYFDHVWGDFAFYYLSSAKKSTRKTLSTYGNLIGSWITSQSLKLPFSIELSTNNRPPGYDWAWALLDNGWNIFLGNLTFFIAEGLGTGQLILSKDGITYDEFSDIRFKYKKMKYLKEFDFYYPTEMVLDAKKGKEKLHLHIKDVIESRYDITDAPNHEDIFGFLISQVPSTISGYYLNGNEKTDINGISWLETYRLLKTSGHNSFKINFNVSKNRFAFFSSLDSIYFKKKMDFTFQLLPKLKLKAHFKRLNKAPLKKE